MAVNSIVLAGSVAGNPTLSIFGSTGVFVANDVTAFDAFASSSTSITTEDEAAGTATGSATATNVVAVTGIVGENGDDNFGVWIGGDELQPTTTATTVRIREGATQTTDGPFAETREALGGYFLLDCKDLDEALSYAASIPAASMGGSVEVRALNEN